MKYFFIIILLGAFQNTFSQQQSNWDFDKIEKNLGNDRLYIVCRGTHRKANLIAGNFNYSDSSITHIGIGFKIDSLFRIWHVTDALKGNVSALQSVNLQEFLNDSDIFYYSIWEYRGSPIDSKKLDRYCSLLLQENIRFDYDFQISADNKLYCSEFCARVLLNQKQLAEYILPRCIMIENKLISNYLNRHVIIYFPVDFFQQIPGFYKVKDSNNPEIS